MLLAKLAGAIAAPMVQFAGLLEALPRNFAYGLKALIDQQGGVPEEAPAADEPAAEPEADAAAEEAPSEEPTAEAETDAPAEEAPTEEPAAEADTTDAPVAEEAPTEEPAADDTTTEE